MCPTTGPGVTTCFQVWRALKYGALLLCRLIEIGFEKMVVAMDAKEAAAMVRLWLTSCLGCRMLCC